MVGDFLQKMQIARQEFEQGKAVREILFSDNPGIIPRRSTPIVTRPTVTRPIVTVPPKPTVTRPTVTPKPAVTPRPVAALPPARVPTPARPTPMDIRQQAAAKLKAEQEAKTRAAAERTRQAVEEAKRQAAARVPEPPTDFFSTLARGFARRTGIKPEPPPPYKEWLVP